MRLFTPNEAGAVFAAVERNRAYLREWLPWVDETTSPAVVAEFIGRVHAQYNNQQGPQCGIWVGGVLVGSIGCHPIDWSNRACAIGYWIVEARAGRGIVTRCCTALLRHLFDELGIHRVEIRCGTGNRKSCAIPERLGFQSEGIAREAQWVSGRWVDLVMWSMLQEDWRASTSSPQ